MAERKVFVMGKFREGAGCALVGIAYPIMGILGLVIHVWTILIAFAMSGLVGAVITLMVPVLAQIFWFIKAWSLAGTVLNLYCLGILAYIACLVVVFVGMAIMDSSES